MNAPLNAVSSPDVLSVVRYYPDGEDAYFMSMDLTGWIADEHQEFALQQQLMSERMAIV